MYKVDITEEYDGFAIEVKEFHEHGIISSRFFYFHIGDSKEGLAEVFKEMGIESTYGAKY